MGFDRDFSVMVMPEGQRVPLMHYQNLILIDIERGRARDGHARTDAVAPR